MLTRRSVRPVKDGPSQDLSSPDEIDLAAAGDFQIGRLEVQPSILQVHFDGAGATLEPRVMQLLVALANASEAVVSRDQLVDLCWAGRAVSEDAINRGVAKVRKLGSDSRAFEIETIPRVGYRLRETGSRPTRGKRFGSFRWLAIAAAAIAVVILAIALLLPRGGGPNTVQPRVAVLGFSSLNSGVESQHFADSIAAAVSDALVTTDADVVALSQPTAESARKAGADFLISGSVRSEGDSIHVAARIAMARTGDTLLGATFDMPSNEAAAAPDRLATWAADSVGSWSWILRFERDPDRIAALIQIQRYWYEDDVRAYHLSRDLAERAPNSGAAQWAFAAIVPFALSDLPESDRREAVEAARAAGRRAHALLPEAGDLAMMDCGLAPPGQFVFTAACEDRVQKALKLDPDAYYLPLFYAAGLGETGRYTMAEPVSRKALAAAPFSANRVVQRLLILSMLPPHADSQAEVLAREAAARRQWASPTPVDTIRYQVLLGRGAMDQAEGMLRDPHTSAMIETDAGGPAHLVFRAIHSRKPEDIRAAGAACGPRWMPPDLVFGTCITGLAVLDDLDDVFSLAERGYGDHVCCSTSQVEQNWLLTGGQTYPRQYLFGGAMAKVRADPRFIDIARRTGLLAYWKSGRPPDFCSSEQAPVCDLLNSK